MPQFITPVSGALTQSFKPGQHYGVDIGAADHSTVHAAQTGRVIFEGIWGMGGNTIQIKGTDGFVTIYCHLSKFLVSMGSSVQQGDAIALSGGALGEVGAGNANAPHLHFEIHNPDFSELSPAASAIDPQIYIPIGGSALKIMPMSPNNSTLGKINSSINGAISTPLDAVGNTLGGGVTALTGAGKALGFLTNSANWKRIGLFAAGSALIGIVIVKTLGESSAVKSVTGLAAKAA